MMARPDLEYMQAHGYDTAEEALVAMIEKVSKADEVFAERDNMLAAHEESITELKAQLEQSQATIDMLEQRIADYERAMAPATEPPPPTEPNYDEFTEPEGTQE